MLAAVLVLSVMLAQGSGPPLTVSAAVSLTEALEEAATAYRAAGGTAVIFNFGGSNTLARQILNGAPADVFISADEAQMDVVEKAELVVAGTRAAIVTNSLVLVADPRSPVTAVTDLGAAEVRRIAIGDPAAVPAGVYARQYLERIGQWTRVERKIVPVPTVRAALTAVQNGSADAAFVYATDARIAPALRVVATISGSQAPRIVYPGCVVKTTPRRAEAAKFLQFLRTAPARAIFERHGFVAGTDAR
jgi:molybdate transport system substrate-binding protein